MFSLLPIFEESEQLQQHTIIYIVAKLKQQPQSIEYISLETCVEILSNPFPFSVLTQTQRIIDYIIEFNYRNQAIPAVLEFLPSLFNSDENNLLIAATIIRKLLKPPSGFVIIEGIGTREDLIEAINPFIEPLVSSISEIESILLIHTILLVMNSYLNLNLSIPDDFIEQWITVITSLLALDTRTERPFIDKDCTKICLSLVELCFNDLNEDIISILLQAIISHLGNSPSFKALSNSIRFIYDIANKKELWEDLSSSFPDYLKQVILPILYLNSEYVSMFSSDPGQFISLVYDLCGLEFSSPRSSVIWSLKLLSQKYNEIPQMCLEIVQNGIEEALQNKETHKFFSLAQFAFCCLFKSQIEDVDFFLQFVQLFFQYFQIDHFTQSAFFLVLSSCQLPTSAIENINDIINYAIQAIAEFSSPIVSFFASIVLSNYFQDNEISRDQIIIEDLARIFQSLVEINKMFPGEQSIRIFLHFVNFFENDLLENAIAFVDMLNSLIHENPSETLNSSSISEIYKSFLTKVEDPSLLGTLCEMSILSLHELSSEASLNYKLIYLIYDILLFIPGIPSSFSFFPSYLHDLYQFDDYFLHVIGKIYLFFTKIEKDESLAVSILELLQEICPNIEQKTYESILFLCQSLFINLNCVSGIGSNVQNIIALFPSDCEPRLLGDIIATLALGDPIFIFNDQIRVNIFIELSSILPFLAACQVIFSNWESMPEPLLKKESEIRSKITYLLEKINDERDNELYDKQAFIEFFS